MNKTDRLLAIVLELQRKGKQRAEDLARTFETSKRTIYRDIEALCEAGVPLVSTPGRGYSLMEGYFLPPLSFTSAEATILLLGSDFMAQNFDAQYRAAAQSAQRKIENILNEHLRDEVHALQQSIRFVAMGPSTNPVERQKLLQLRTAILDRKTLRLHYYTRHSNEGEGYGTQNVREVDPYGLISIHNIWFLVAYCHLRQDMRNFRLDRIESLELLDKTFQRPADFEMRERTRERDIVVRVQFDHEVARWVREARSYYAIDEQETADGLQMTLRIRHESEIMHWLLSWGRHVRVLEPEGLRSRIQEEARALLQNHQPAEELSRY